MCFRFLEAISESVRMRACVVPMPPWCTQPQLRPRFRAARSSGSLIGGPQNRSQYTVILLLWTPKRGPINFGTPSPFAAALFACFRLRPLQTHCGKSHSCGADCSKGRVWAHKGSWLHNPRIRMARIRPHHFRRLCCYSGILQGYGSSLASYKRSSPSAAKRKGTLRKSTFSRLYACQTSFCSTAAIFWSAILCLSFCQALTQSFWTAVCCVKRRRNQPQIGIMRLLKGCKGFSKWHHG